MHANDDALARGAKEANEMRNEIAKLKEAKSFLEDENIKLAREKRTQIMGVPYEREQAVKAYKESAEFKSEIDKAVKAQVEKSIADAIAEATPDMAEQCWDKCTALLLERCPNLDVTLLSNLVREARLEREASKVPVSALEPVDSDALPEATPTGKGKELALVDEPEPVGSSSVVAAAVEEEEEEEEIMPLNI